MGLLDDLAKYMGPKTLAAGDRPGTGIYLCEKCKRTIRLEQETDTLPACPHCQHTNYL